MKPILLALLLLALPATATPILTLDFRQNNDWIEIQFTISNLYPDTWKFFYGWDAPPDATLGDGIGGAFFDINETTTRNSFTFSSSGVVGTRDTYWNSAGVLRVIDHFGVGQHNIWFDCYYSETGFEHSGVSYEVVPIDPTKPSGVPVTPIPDSGATLGLLALALGLVLSRKITRKD